MCAEICTLRCKALSFNNIFFLMELRGTEVVLGLDWLASLGNIEANFRNLCLKWSLGGQKYMIEDDPTLCTGQASWKAVMKALNDEGIGFLCATKNQSRREGRSSPSDCRIEGCVNKVC